MKLRKGFTLVELLIVIVIIGILAAAMLLSSGSATDSAEASNIVTNMRGLKSAATMHYADSMDTYTDGDAATIGSIVNLIPYMDNPEKIDQALYTFTASDTDRWWINYNATNLKDGIRQKIQGRSASIGLYNTNTVEPIAANYYTADDNNIHMVAR